MQISGQILGIVAMAVSMFSFQCRKNRNLYLFQGLSGFFFGISFILLNGGGTVTTAAAFNFINVLRGLIMMRPKLRKTPLLVLLTALYTLAAVLTFDGWVTVMLVVIQYAGTLAMWHDEGEIIRAVQFFMISPAWLIHNIFIVFSIGGIICELFNIVSVIISFVRYKKTGFEKTSGG